MATVSIEMNGLGALDATVWSVNGLMFSIEYKGSVGDFEEAAAGMDPLPGFRISCGLTADLSAASRVSGRMLSSECDCYTSR